MEHDGQIDHLPVQVGAQRFGQRVRHERKARDWSQSELAERMTAAGYPLHQTAVARIESGKRPTSIQEAYALAAVLGLPGGVTTLFSQGREESRLVAEITSKRAEIETMVAELAAARTAQARLHELERDLVAAQGEHADLVRQLQEGD